MADFLFNQFADIQKTFIQEGNCWELSSDENLSN
jgi:hypothetical protein